MKKRAIKPPRPGGRIEWLESRRLLAVGDLDTTFAPPNGYVVRDVQGGHQLDLGSAMAVQSDGRVLLSGHSSGAFAPVVRYTSTGALDTSFGTNGSVTIPGAISVVTMLALPGGSILVGGTWGASVTAALKDLEPFVARLTSTGALDSTFGTGGVARGGNFVANAGASTGALAMQPNGAILAAVAINHGDSMWSGGAARFTSTGQLDTTFDSDGRLVAQNSSWSFGELPGTGIAALRDGSILIASNVGTAQGTSGLLMRRTSTGAPDTTFGTNGTLTLSNIPINCLVPSTSGKWLIGGPLDGDAYAARLTSTGTLDTTFGSGGFARMDFGSEDDRAYSVATLSDGSVVAAGTNSPGVQTPQAGSIGIAFFTAAGVPDVARVPDGYVIREIGISATEARRIAIRPDGDLQIGGTFRNINGYDWFVAELKGVPEAAPIVVATKLDPATGTTLSLTFNVDVFSTLTASDLTIQNLTTGATIASVMEYGAQPNTGRWQFNSPGGRLPDGSYRLTMPAGAVSSFIGTPSTSAYTFNFIWAGGTTSNDTMRVQLDSVGTTVQVFQNAAAPFTATASTLNGVFLGGQAGTDALTVELVNGNPLVATGTFGFDGGSGTDTITILGRPSAAETTTFAASSIVLNGANIAIGAVEQYTFDGRGGLDAVTVNAGPAVTFPATQNFQSLSIGSGASAALISASSAILVVRNLTIAATGKLDLNDDDLLTSNTAKSAVESAVRTAYNFGNWNGAGGIFSTTAKNNPSNNTMLGVMSGGEYFSNANSTLFNGLAVLTGDVLVKYTYYGDVDFNGQVDTTDYNLIDFGFLTGRSGWANGDVDFNSQVDTTDYNLIDFAFLTQGAGL